MTQNSGFAGSSPLVTLVALLAPRVAEVVVAVAFPEPLLVVAGLDERLNERGYIVPGLGDAGDRLYGVV